MSSPSQIIRLAARDNVVVARLELEPGSRIDGEDIVITTAIPGGHKIATREIRRGDPVLKLGEAIGFATSDIAPGEHVHTHNCNVGKTDRDYSPASQSTPTDFLPADQRRSFTGYLRPSGTVGTRNYIGVITTVNCAATVARHACTRIEGSGVLGDYPNVDGIVPVIHTSGCGMANDGVGLEILQRTLLGFVRHPNFAAVLLVGLGCEVNQISELMAVHGLQTGDTLQILTIQTNCGTRQTIETIVERISSMLPQAENCKRQPAPASELVVGLQCGGSDGYTAITANPALGAAADLLVRNHGTAILSETPEIYGAEHLLCARAKDRAIGEKLIALMDWWQKYVASHGTTLNNNPSPGNLNGGISTIFEKSLGAAAKGGTTDLMEVYQYAEPVTSHGLVFMDSPGYDPCSVTGQVASGATLVCFTTGRGSVFGNKPCPSIKIATNTSLYLKMSDDMDINAGLILDGEATVDEIGARIFDTLLRVASGEKTKSEEWGFGDNEFVPWQIGAVI